MMLLAKRSIFLFFLIFLFQYSYSQGVKIKIINDDSELPISHVLVKKTGPDSIRWISNDDGIVQLTKRLTPEDSLIFQHIGFQELRISYKDVIQMEYTVRLKLSWDDLPPVVFSASNRETENQRTAVEVIHIASKDIQLQNPQTTADILASSGKVFVQKSQLGGGSPMIRGMSANRVLIVVDGIRMNNAIFRSGNLQNVISVDPNLVLGAEVMLGPGSVVYGTDAIGGVMSFRLREPQLAGENKVEYHGNAMARFSSANRESSWHVDFEIRRRKISFLSSVTMSNFGDLRMGSNGPDEYLRNEYVELTNGYDTMVRNSNPQIQRFSGYSQINLMQKMRWQIKDSLNLKFALHYGTTSPIPRYDRLIQKDEDGKLQYGDWYYGPQNWLMTNVQLIGNRKTFFTDQARWTFAYQNFQESRVSRSFGSTRQTERAENVHMFTANADLDKILPKVFTIYYGAEFIHNVVGSKAFTQDIVTTEKEFASTRYPNGSTWSSSSIYAKLNRSLGKRWDVEAGARYGIIQYKADLTNQGTNFLFPSIDETVNGQSASAGLIYHNKSIIRLSASTGFRAPNIDDVGKVFDSEPGKVIVPNAGLKPEFVQSFDLSWERNWSNKLLVQLSGFYSELKDAITRGNFTYNGLDSMFYDGTLNQIQALVNTESATIYGFQAYFDYKFTSKLKVNSSINYTDGETSDGEPLRHVTPLFGTTQVSYKSKRFTHVLYAVYNGEIPFENMAPSEQDKPHMYAMDDNGNPYSPSWWTLNYKTKFTYSERLSFLAGAENILDRRYRPYSSGITAPGLNIYLSIRARF